MAAVDEIKWKVFQARRERLQAKPDLWRLITDAMNTATIVIIKPGDAVQNIQEYLDDEHAEDGVDYNRAGVINVCSVMLIAETPVAYLRNRLAERLALYPHDLYLSFDKFAPDRSFSGSVVGYAMRRSSLREPTLCSTLAIFRLTTRGLRIVSDHFAFSRCYKS